MRVKCHLFFRSHRICVQLAFFHVVTVLQVLVMNAHERRFLIHLLCTSFVFLPKQGLLFCISITPMLWNKREARVDRTEKHLGDVNPILWIPAPKQRFQLRSTNIVTRTLINRLRSFEDSYWYISTKKGEPFQEKSSCPIDSLSV